MNLPQYVLTVTNLFEYKTDIVAKILDIFVSLLYFASFSIADVSPVKDIFSRNKLIAKVCFDLKL